MALLARKKIILAAVETTYGTDAAPTGATNAILARNISLTPLEQDVVNRNLQRPYLGGSQDLPVNERVMLDFEVEMQGSGTAGTAPAWGPLMRMCAFSQTVSAGTSAVYAPVSSGFESGTIYINVDGVLHKLKGARGTMSLSAKVKEIPTFKFTFTGLFMPITDAAPPVPVYTPWRDPLPVNATNTVGFTLHGYAGCMSGLQIDTGGSVVHRSLVGCVEQVLYTDRDAKGSITIEATTVAQKDWWTICRTGAMGALDVTHGTAAGLRVRIQAPNVQLSKPSYSEEDGVQMLGMTMKLVPGSSGNDELTITCL